MSIKRIVAELHTLHLTDVVIARLVGRHPSQVRRILNAIGLRVRWSRPEEAVAALPQTLIEYIKTQVDLR